MVLAVTTALTLLFLEPVSATPSVGSVPASAAAAAASSVTTWPLSQLIEQLIMVSGQFSSPGSSGPMAAAGVGGIVFFGQPASGSGPAIRSGISALVQDATSHGQVVPWMSTDEEGGPIARLSNVIGALPAPRQMAAQWSPAQVQAAMASHGAAMRSLGVTMDLAPVLDTANSGNPVAGESYRSFSENGHVAATYGLAYANGLGSSGVVPVAKHFPGLGHATANTDLGPATDPSLAQLEGNDLIPFEQAVAARLPVVMVGHPVVPGLTGNVPASLSPATYHFLRGTLGFQGVALTDDLDANAISAAGYSQPAAAVKAIQAGADMVMVDVAQWSGTVNALSQAVASGQLPLASVESSVARIVSAKSADTKSYEVALQTSTNDLSTLGSQNKDWMLGQAAGTSPSVGAFLAGGYQLAFQARTGALWTVGSAGNTNWNLGIRAGTSPTISALPTGGFEVAFQANTGALWTVGSAGNTNWNLGMRAGTSPSISALPTGGFEVAFQANTGALWTVGRGSASQNRNWLLGLMPGTSPSIAALPTGGFEVAFQANTGALWTVGSAGNTNWNLGMRAGTSPSIATLPIGGFEVAFQANTGALWTVGHGLNAQNKNWQVGMLAGTSPSIHSTS
jgi:beta-glucosidase-like glycosyl hydrolase